MVLLFSLFWNASPLLRLVLLCFKADRSTELFDPNDLESYLSSWKNSSINKHRNVRLVSDNIYSPLSALFARLSTTKKQLCLQRWEQCWRRSESTRLPSMCDFLTSCHRAVFKWLSKVITLLRLLRLVIGLKDSRQLFSQRKAKPKPIAPCTRDFSRATSEL